MMDGDAPPLLEEDEAPELLCEEDEAEDGQPSVPAKHEQGTATSRVPVTIITGFLGAGKVCQALDSCECVVCC